MKRCPFCAEEIQENAIKCRHCGEWLKEGEVRQESATLNKESAKPMESEANVIEVMTKEQEKLLSIKDIPRFALGKFYVSVVLILGTLWGGISSIFLIWGIIDKSLISLIFSERQLATYQIATLNLALSIVSILNLAISMMLVTSALGLRKRKRYGLILTYIITVWTVIASIVYIIGGAGSFMARLGKGGIVTWIGIGFLVYFYGRRKYFNT